MSAICTGAKKKLIIVDILDADFFTGSCDGFEAD